jgi:ubiquinone/menaquinone biosynthesis C-methylase UbiE
MAQFHFVEDYERLVARLVDTYPIDEAMSLVVGGGSYEIFGQMEAEIVQAAGLEDGMRLIDLGCGSGRLAAALHRSMDVSYVGIDIVQALLDYAKSKAPGYQFVLHRGLSIPLEQGSADMVSAFSLFTHLLQSETYIYLEESARILKPGGKIVFSFLEFAEAAHWKIFESTRMNARDASGDHLNMFIERNAIDIWAEKLGLVVERYFASSATWSGHALGQSIAVLRKSSPGRA